MDRVAERLATAQKALSTLREIDLAQPDPSAIVRDAAIQRFDYTFETVWKDAKAVVGSSEGVDVPSPMAAIRAGFRAGILNEDQARAAMRMANDRNLTVHTYSENLAARLFARPASHAELLTACLSALDKHAQENDDTELHQ